MNSFTGLSSTDHDGSRLTDLRARWVEQMEERRRQGSSMNELGDNGIMIVMVGGMVMAVVVLMVGLWLSSDLQVWLAGM